MLRDWRAVVSGLSRLCPAAGFCLVQPFQVQRYNHGVRSSLHLPTYGRNGTLGILIGNSGELWKPFLEYLARNPEKIDEKNPLDNYAEAQISKICSEVLGGDINHEIRYAYETAEERVVQMQLLAHVSGLANFHTEIFMCVHPTYGPWHAYRAAILVDLLYDEPAPTPVPVLCDENDLNKARAAFQKAVECAGNECGAPDWMLWLDVRDSILYGRGYRYPQEQIVYHYSKDKTTLRKAVEKVAAQLGIPRSLGA
eukprot:comp7151_c0_seq1/m.2873 comp7151_c0_seq1/g.2873  ORF comp7151_c0_seq1/g.2873 comp7151_c0_seq1/m.2873 type:complete len:254 (-) comp7151_c0_seq1:33-794(-)